MCIQLSDMCYDLKRVFIKNLWALWELLVKAKSNTPNPNNSDVTKTTDGSL